MSSIVRSYVESSDWFAVEGLESQFSSVMVYGAHKRRTYVKRGYYSERAVSGNNKFFITPLEKGERPEMGVRSVIGVYKDYIDNNPRYYNPAIVIMRVKAISLAPDRAEIFFNEPHSGKYVLCEVEIKENKENSISETIYEGDIIF